LVYEFVPKGSLDVILHGDKSIPLSLGQRLQIAAESAEGLAFMHSKTTAKILHGDVKPANILINNDYAPKISDFGISRLIATGKEQTGTVIGDVNYMDPVFVQTGMLTNKSDVYSFGVVLLELITRKKASRSNQNGLLSKFSEAYKKDKSMIELVDKELVEVDPQLLYILAGIINECLSLDVNERPYMTDIEERLRDIVKRFRSTE
jgi:serine/threonine protein kinase